MTRLPKRHILFIFFLFILILIAVPRAVRSMSGLNLQSSFSNEGTVVSQPETNSPQQVSQNANENDLALDWPQVQRDPQRTGYSPEVLGTTFPYTVAWTHAFQPEKVFPQVQVIIYDGKVYVGTEMGNLYALDAKTGEQVWKYSIGAPVLSSVAAGDGLVFVGAMDGAVYALGSGTGTLAWKSQLLWRHGFSTAPVLAENKVMLGGRNGAFYALDTATGAALWQYEGSSPILQTPAYNNGQVFFGAMNMHVYALNTSDGSLAWKSEQIPGMAFKDYWPVVHSGKVIVRPMGKGSVSDLAACDASPESCQKTLFVLDEATGVESPAVQHSDYPNMHGAFSPPCVDRNNKLVVPFDGMWGELDLTTRMVGNMFVDATGEDGVRNSDELGSISCANNLVFVIHSSEDNGPGLFPAYSGAFDLDNWTWINAFDHQGHITFEMKNNTQGGGGNPVSISNGTVYHISFHQLIARTAQP